MALLTADEVHNKKFRGTKFRDGYDPDEVDDFLDEIVNTLSAHETTLSSLERENEELKSKLAAAERRVAELSSNAPAPAQEPAEAEVVEEPEPEKVEESARFAPPAEIQQTVAAQHAGEPESATRVIEIAQRLHDELVNEGREKSERLVTEAQQTADKLVREAEETHNRTLAQLEQERSVLERKIDELRVFERDYRTRLKSYLESLLHEVEGRGVIPGGRRSEGDSGLR